MQHRDWRELAEAVGFVTIVGVLVMIALEQRSANDITARMAEAEAERSLAAMYTSMNMARAANPEIARVFAKMASPQGQLITATDTSQARAIARQYLNICRTAQSMHDHGLLSDAELAQCRRLLETTIEEYPGLHDALVAAFAAMGEGAKGAVLEPVARLAAETRAGNDD